MDNFNIKSILVILFLFFIGCVMGWCIEVIFRKFISKSNPSHKWINPGFLIGPYLPLYGSGLVVLYLLSLIHIDAVDSHPVLQKILVILIMTIAMTVVEYIAGRIFIIGMNIKLWDYSDEWGNIQGIICPRFSFFWGVIAALYYFFLHPHTECSVLACRSPDILLLHRILLRSIRDRLRRIIQPDEQGEEICEGERSYCPC